jgi:predicted NBD/HSP70 family sugar kinase
MLERLVAFAKRRSMRLSPLIGVACPGNILPDGSIERGAQNLPGNWESKSFNLTTQLSEALPVIDGHPTHVIVHNDAVVQGLAEAPFMKGIRRWGVLTIGTGLGNARFTNRRSTKAPAKRSAAGSGSMAAPPR